MPAARPAYGLPDVTAASERPAGVATELVVALILFVGLAVAAIWYVAVPMLDKPAPVTRSCEVVLLKGSARCVSNPSHRSETVPQKPTPSHRANR